MTKAKNNLLQKTLMTKDFTVYHQGKISWLLKPWNKTFMQYPFKQELSEKPRTWIIWKISRCEFLLQRIPIIRNQLNKLISFVLSNLCDYIQLVYHDWLIPNYPRNFKITTVSSLTRIHSQDGAVYKWLERTIKESEITWDLLLDRSRSFRR